MACHVTCGWDGGMSCDMWMGMSCDMSCDGSANNYSDSIYLQ